MKKIFSLVWLCLIISIPLVSTVNAQTNPPPTDDQVNAVAKQLYCPVCENIPLDVCPTQACEEWRELIRLKLSEGWNSEQIKTYFAEQYGDRVLATPPARGLHWLIYIIPPLVFLAGVFLLFRVFKAFKRPLETSNNPPSPSSEPLKDEYIARLEEELKNR